ncbi:MAG TPA: hypothetical protein VMV46_03925 [Thermoanaerobaculia bacterium]|nr:hypothetical protein [Thermoanaerobaculia bacterium]
MNRLARLLLAAAALSAAAWSVADQRARRQELAAVERSFAEVAPTAAVARRLDTVAGEVEPARARLVAARELVLGVVASLPPESPTQRRLLAEAAERAREMAARVFADRPSDAEAATVLGASTYLSRSLARDHRLFTEASAWEDPLQRAIELAPGSGRAAEFLAMAYLDVWGNLSPRKREVTLDLLREGFRSPETFRRLIPTWLRLAPDLDTALGVVPDDPFAWTELAGLLASQQDWTRMLVVEERRREKLHEDFARRLEAAAASLEAGRPSAARLLLLGILKEAEIDGRYAPQIARALEILPPGPVDPDTAARLGRWLDWGMGLCLLSPCPFPPEAVLRLEVLSAAPSLATRAAAALAAGDLREGERLARSAPGAAGLEWAPYRLFAARLARDRGRLDEAAELLDGIPADWSWSPLVARERRELARLHTPGGVRRAEAAATPPQRRWEAYQWVQRRGSFTLALEPSVTGGVWLEPTSDALVPAVLALGVDGAPSRLLLALPGEPLVTGVVLTPGIHLLRVDRIAGGEVRPGTVTLAR